MKDTVKVVLPVDIYKPENYSYGKMPMANNPMQGSPMEGGYAGADTQSSGIHFSPVIKIMNGGSDFSSGGGPPTIPGTKIPVDGGMSMNPIMPTLSDNHSNSSSSAAARIESSVNNAEPPPPQASTSGGGVVDFFKSFVIKKV
jgi:hypothetical protein